MATQKKPTKAVAPKPGIKFDPDDFPYLEAVLDTKPDLKICALAVKRARENKFRYPIKDPVALKTLIGGKETLLEDHSISLATIRKFMLPQEFPIENEEQLIARIHMALVRGRSVSSFSGVANGPAVAGKTKKR